MDIEVNLSFTDKSPFSNDNDTSFAILFLSSSAMSTPEAIGTAISLSAIMMGTVVGNVLVILSVFTYKPLRNVQNMFIVSLAVADIAVAVCVMPFNVAYSIIGKWMFGLGVCEMWLTCDILCCTASILNLCAIALDRYWAIHDPVNYAHKRTLKRVLCMILLVWVISGIISVPPLIGWNDWPEIFTEDTQCKLTQEKGFVLYSASGSFYIPLVIMTTVYLKIFQATKRRLRERAKIASQMTSKKGSGKQLDIPLNDLGSNTEGAKAPVASCETSPRSSPTEHNNPSNNTPVTTSSRRKLENGEPPPLTVRQYMEEKQRISLSRERRAARILGIVMGIFVLCWLPFFLMYVIVPFCSSCDVSNRMVNFITWLGYVNSALNPIIYTIFNKDFRQAFRKLLCDKR